MEGISQQKEQTKKEPHVKQEDFYYDVVDHDDDYDGFIHIVSVRDGSEIKLDIEALKNSLKKRGKL